MRGRWLLGARRCGSCRRQDLIDGGSEMVGEAPGRRTTALLNRWQGRLLDPSRHRSSGVGGVAGATAYRHDGLSVGSQDPEVRSELSRTIEQATAGTGCRCEFSGGSVRFIVDGSGRVPDPFTVLRAVRRSENSRVRQAVGLDHLLSVAEQIGGNPFAIGHGQPGLDQYGVIAAYQGRGPVVLTGAEPGRRASRYQPRVVVLDTGVGEHPWFSADPAVTTVRLTDRSIDSFIDAGQVRPREYRAP